MARSKLPVLSILVLLLSSHNYATDDRVNVMIPPPTASQLERLRQDIVFSDILLGRELTFHTTWGLFSPKEVDAGTRLLLDYLDDKQVEKVLDVGCGYGALGLTLASLHPEAKVTLVDKDFVAIDYCQKNADTNELDNTEVFLSNGLNRVEEYDFDLIVTNLPAKSGKELYTLMFSDMHTKLQTGGACYIVTINGLRQFVKRNFIDVFGNYKKLKQGPVYTVAMAVRQ